MIPSFAFAQLPMIPYSGGFSGTANGFYGTARFDLHGRPIQLKTGAPYSAESKMESVQTLPNGIHVTHNMLGRSQKVWRDSQGRVRIEQSLVGSGMANSAYKFPTLVQIDDPVAGCIYIMDDVTRIAHRVKAQVVPQGNLEPRIQPTQIVEGGGGVGGAAAVPAKPMPRVSSEDLGTQVLDGIPVHGTRTTTVIPTGSQGNDGPITTLRDTWFSPDLNLVIQTVMNDPRSGIQTNGIANLSRNDPSPSLFMVPPDYTIVDETGSFTIKWGTQ
jgi:hypothetical protein